MQYLLDAVEFGVIVIDADERISYVNRWLQRRLRTDVEGGRFAERLQGQLEPRLVRAVRECLSTGHAMRLSHAFHPMPLPLYAPGEDSAQRMRHAVDVVPVQPAPGAPRQCMLQIRDMGEIARREHILKEQSRQLGIELKRVNATQQELSRQSQRFKEMTRLAPVGLFETDGHGGVTYFNDRAAEMLGLNHPPPACDRRWLAHLPEAEIQRLWPTWQAATAARVRFAEEVCVTRDKADPVWLRVEAGPLRLAGQDVCGYIGTVTDVTEFHQHAQRFEYRANHDVLTGLCNRERFEQALSEAIRHCQRHPDRQVAVLFIDLNRFKPVNDAHGHSAGDLVLKTIGTRLRQALRGDDLVARIGGDEFAILLTPAPTHAVIEAMLSKLTRFVAAPVHIGSHQIRVGCSVGTAFYPDDGDNIASLMRHADKAMYHQKFRERDAPLPPIESVSMIAPLLDLPA